MSANDFACQGFNVSALLDRAGALVERIVYDAYGRPTIRECAGRGDMTNDSKMTSTDTTRVTDAKNGTIWDARADLDDDGDVDAADESLYTTKKASWPTAGFPTVAQAFSDFGNLYLFQGVPHYALDTQASDTEGKLLLNHHRARMADPVTGRWGSRDPLIYGSLALRPVTPSQLDSNQHHFTSRARFDQSLYQALGSRPTALLDNSGEDVTDILEGLANLIENWLAPPLLDTCIDIKVDRNGKPWITNWSCTDSQPSGDLWTCVGGGVEAAIGIEAAWNSLPLPRQATWECLLPLRKCCWSTETARYTPTPYWDFVLYVDKVPGHIIPDFAFEPFPGADLIYDFRAHFPLKLDIRGGQCVWSF